MRALTVTGFGGPEVLKVREVDTPSPGPGEITIDVSHAAVGLIDALLRRGDFRDAPGLPRPPYTPGLEVAGTVREIGAGVTGPRPGEVVATLTLPGMGGLAEVVAAPAPLVVPLGGTVPPEQGAAALGNAATAHLALGAAHLRPGERVLVHGVTGALASVFPAVAAALGAAEVVGTVRRPERIAAAEELGLDRAVLSSDFPGAIADARFDVVVDPVGGELRRRSPEVLNRYGRLLVVGDASGEDVALSTDLIWQRAIGVIGFNVGAVLAEDPTRGAAAGRAVLPLLADGRLRLPVTTAPLADAADTFARFERGAIGGRLLLIP
ncbi:MULTISPECIES: quinone oxidoreductase family protein [unclassified Nocardiopsis]|uniref:quinone oxidoreductase family protein n=1 Tax=Nocardiopsis TaxID=2013 RepID=UPI00387B9AF5